MKTKEIENKKEKVEKKQVENKEKDNKKVEKKTEKEKITNKEEKEKNLTEKEISNVNVSQQSSTEKKQEKAKEEKNNKKLEKKTKKSEAKAIGKDLPISTKHAVFICKEIKNKEIKEAINLLEKVRSKKIPIKMNGEIPHKKGKGISSGRFPKKASEYFIKLLKSLEANSRNNEIEKAFIYKAIANKASRPAGRFGGIKKKRTHVLLISKEKK